MSRILLAALAVGWTASLHAQTAQPTTHSGAFIARLGVDTIGVERFSLAGDAYNVEQVLHTPVAALYHTHLGLTPQGGIGEVIHMHHDAVTPSAPLLGSTRLTFKSADSAEVVTKQGDSSSTKTVAASAMLVPSLPRSWLPYEIAARRLIASGADSATMQFLDVSGSTQRVIVRRIAPDSMTFALPFLTYRAQVDEAGRIAHLYQPNGIRVERVPTVDINGIAARWESLERQGRGMGLLSPRDTAAAHIGPAEITVDYSRPSMRGRDIWGALVPWNRVWRTGANEPTTLQTNRALTIGGAAIPAGSYTLTTLPTAEGTTLVISAERNGAQPAEVARVDLTTTALPEPVEQFTITIEPLEGNRATLALAWDRRRMTAPIVVR